MTNEINQCDECGSEYFSLTSEMMGLCPECASILYGYDNCKHIFREDKRCSICYWDGSSNEYLNSFKKNGK